MRQKSTHLRTNIWLEKRLDYLWRHYFNDIPRINKVAIKFGRPGRHQLGAIIAKGPRRRWRRPGRFPKISWWLPESTTTITINGTFRHANIPIIIIDSVITHELVHYAHGFSSPHPQLFRYPHQGSIVSKELKKRGLGDMLKIQKQWLKTSWPHHQ